MESTKTRETSKIEANLQNWRKPTELEETSKIGGTYRLKLRNNDGFLRNLLLLPPVEKRKKAA